MYLEAITWKANSSGSEDNHGSNGSSTPASGVDDSELFKSRIMLDNIRLLKRHLNLNGMGMLIALRLADILSAS
jgi:hypothetical protein